MKIKRILLLSIGVLALSACQNNSAKTTSSSSNFLTESSTTSTTNTTSSSSINTSSTFSTTSKDDDVSTSTINPVTSSTIDTTTTIVDTTTSEGNTTTNYINDDEATTIFLAGDSTVKTYIEKQYIGGWGQYLDLFLDENITVKNCAQGGRSSRSFINEGRLYDIEGATYTFSENGGNSIGDEIKEGDYLFIQFGHNDDDTKAANSLAERMVPLGEAVDGIYPTTPGEKTTIVKENGVATIDSVSASVQTAMSSYGTVLSDYLTKSVSKYGDSYYEYSSGGTYKWFLKQYIDFARSKNATPVLVTPVARLAFNSDGTLRSGAGLHGEDFAYVKAVRQLASEENCLLIDLFSDTKDMLETTQVGEAYYLMALKDASGSNSNAGDWPAGFDTEYKTATKEQTHYNKFGAYLAAGKVAEHLKEFISSDTKGKNGEAINFKKSVLSAPESYIAPSNLMHKATVKKLYDLFDTINPEDPTFEYPDPKIVEDAISKLASDYPTVTQENYLEIKDVCETIRSSFVLVNVDDVESISNISTLEEYENSVAEFVKANKKVATEVITFDPSNMEAQTITSSVVEGDFTIVGTDAKAVTVMTSGTKYTFNDVEYTTTKAISLGGSASFGTSRYIEFSTTKVASITIVAKSTSASADRILKMVDKNKNEIGAFEANGSQSITTLENIAAGTYQVGSAGSGIYVYAIIIEYFD